MPIYYFLGPFLVCLSFSIVVAFMGFPLSCVLSGNCANVLKFYHFPKLRSDLSGVTASHSVFKQEFLWRIQQFSSGQLTFSRASWGCKNKLVIFCRKEEGSCSSLLKRILFLAMISLCASACSTWQLTSFDVGSLHRLHQRWMQTAPLCGESAAC